MSENQDYTKYSFRAALVVLVLLGLLSLLPSFHIFGKSTKKINILSDLLGSLTDSNVVAANAYFDTTFLAEPMPEHHTKDTTPQPVSQEWNLPSSQLIESPTHGGDQKIVVGNAPLVAIEDFGGDIPGMQPFYTAIQNKKRTSPVRIAVLGDSFVEGDIFTADVREQLQGAFSGGGVGFIPFSSPLLRHRATVKHQADKWKVWEVKNRQKAPEELRDLFSISGLLCLPEEGATMQVGGTSFRKYLKQSNAVKLLFINTKNTTLTVKVNGAESHVFRPEAMPNLQEIKIQGVTKSLSVTFNNTEGFVGYGVVFEDKSGVSVDNYSIRGNSGKMLFGSNPTINAQWSKLLHYELIVLQYGLNVMSPTVTDYRPYGNSLTKLINYVKRCFPGSSVLVMSVGDRSALQDGKFVTMPIVHAMIQVQRNTAKESGIAFWNTYDAMGGKNSMVEFVDRKWASKDYTHIGYSGGKYIATAFVRALLAASGATESEKLEEIAVDSIPVRKSESLVP